MRVAATHVLQELNYLTDFNRWELVGKSTCKSESDQRRECMLNRLVQRSDNTV